MQIQNVKKSGLKVEKIHKQWKESSKENLDVAKTSPTLIVLRFIAVWDEDGLQYEV